MREFLEADVYHKTEGRLRYHARVASNVLAIVARELRLGALQARAHAERLARLGFSSDEELCVAIRSGELDDRYDEVRQAVWESVIDKLRVANPDYLAGGSARERG